MTKETARSGKKYRLRLFVAGPTTRSMFAIQSGQQLYEEQWAGHYQLDIIDIYQEPAQARAEQVVATLTLVKQAPLPRRRFVGDLSNTARILIRF